MRTKGKSEPTTASVNTKWKDAFLKVWFKRFGLSHATWREQAQAAVEIRPFADPANLLMLVNALFVEVASAASDKRKLLCEAYGWLVFQAWQSGSHFLSYAENYAEFLLREIRSKAPSASALWIAETICAAKGSAFTNLELSNPLEIRDAEYALHKGDFDKYFKEGIKYSEFDHLLAESSFAAEWRELKRLFPKQTTGTVFHRTLVPERNWVRGEGASFSTQASQFQAALDLLCWKFCLWGIRDSQPILLKPSVTLTPHGTQIFIPAYMSCDLSRDLKLGAISKLHRARGVKRQGDAFLESRAFKKRDCVSAFKISKQLKAQGIKGAEIHERIRQRVGRFKKSDEREIRRAIIFGKRFAAVGD